MAVDCTTKGIYDSLNWCAGQHVVPGIRQRVFYIPKSWIVKWPTLPAIAAESGTMDKLATLTGDFQLAVEKKWLHIDQLTAKGSISSESQGENPSKTFLNKGMLNYAGTDELATGFARQANIDQLVFLVQQRDGKFRLVGSEMFDMDCKVSQTSGEGDTGTGGTSFEVTTTDICPAPFYTGKIETAEGDINGPEAA